MIKHSGFGSMDIVEEASQIELHVSFDPVCNKFVIDSEGATREQVKESFLRLIDNAVLTDFQKTKTVEVSLTKTQVDKLNLFGLEPNIINMPYHYCVEDEVLSMFWSIDDKVYCVRVLSPLLAHTYFIHAKKYGFGSEYISAVIYETEVIDI